MREGTPEGIPSHHGGGGGNRRCSARSSSQIPRIQNDVRGPPKGSPHIMAVAVGFEPTVEFPPHALSRRAPLAARTRHRGREYRPAAGPA